jgi:UDP-2-acetamido-3-amino-2,3-dideoxy-glucuronate N-acetyltransferase
MESVAETTDYFVHESAYVDEPVEIGSGTKIWHFSHIMAGSSIGERCTLGQNVMIGPHVRIGNRVKIQNNVSVYEGVEIEDDVFCGPSMVFTNVATPRSGTPRNRPEDFAPTRVSRGATLGANCTIVCGHTIGEYALVGAGSVVTSDVPPYALAYGNPARVRGYACECGVRLEIESGTTLCRSCSRSYTMADGGLRKVAS